MFSSAAYCILYTVYCIQWLLLKSGKNIHNPMQCRTIQYTALQCSALPCRAVQCSALHCSTVQCSSPQCRAVLFTAVQCSSLQCITVLFTVVQCSVLRCSAVQLTAESAAAARKQQAGRPGCCRTCGFCDLTLESWPWSNIYTGQYIVEKNVALGKQMHWVLSKV